MPSFSLCRLFVSEKLGLAKLFLLLSLVMATGVILPGTAQALPSFAVQTDQPCSACHVGSFGPQLKPFGRDFKLYGYTASDGKDHGVPIALYLRQSFTNTDKGQTPPPANRVYGADANNNFALDEASGWIAGRVNDTTGVYIEGSFDGVGGQAHLDNADARKIHEGKVFGYDYVGGITINDSPTVSDIWNSTPVWGFPFNSSKLATGPAASTLLDSGALGSAVGGLGAYVMVNDWVYLEFDGYKPLSRDGLNIVGTTPVTGVDRFAGEMPYWRAAIQHELVKNHYFQIGTYGISGDVYPNDDHTTGAKNHITDMALDANYQWLGGGNDHFVSAHSTFIHEDLHLGANNLLSTTNPNDRLNTYRAEVSYSYKDTYTPTLQYFRTWGTTDANQWGTPNGSPNSEGFVMELAYVPFGKPDSPAMSWFAYNTRLELQYTAYTQFDGSRSGASNHNTIFLDLGIILSPKW